MKPDIKNVVAAVLIFLVAFVIALVLGNNKKEPNVNITVAIHIKGEVRKPGYYEFDYGSRVKDAIDKAGGVTKEANLDGVNLAAKLRDGEEIIIPSKSEDVSSEKTAQTTLLNDKKVNINAADTVELCTLEGIGENIASLIIEYRNRNGAFRSVEDIKKVKGIGEAKFENIKDSIYV